MKPFALLSPEDKTMYYVLYDLRKDTDPSSLGNIHLPTSMCEGPVLVLVKVEDYEEVVASVREMCVDEGSEWMTTLLIRPKNAPTNTGDLEVNASYIMIAHLALVLDEPEMFMEKLKSMKRQVIH